MKHINVCNKINTMHLKNVHALIGLNCTANFHIVIINVITMEAFINAVIVLLI